MDFYLLILSCLISQATAWNQPLTNTGTCSSQHSSCCGVMEKLDKILATLEVIAKSKSMRCAILKVKLPKFYPLS